MAMALAVADDPRIPQPVSRAASSEAGTTAEPIVALREGQTLSWERLLVRMERRALALAWRILNDAHLAADAVQDSFVKAYTGRGALHAGSDVERWLLAIVANTARDLARQKARTQGLLHQNVNDLAEQMQSGALWLANGPQESDLEQRLRWALSRLDEQARMIFLLVHQEGFSYEAVAKEFGWPLGTVRSTLHRTRLRLRELLGAREVE